ncbi:MAG: calcium/sodium antiporter [Prevotella sp.]|nr:calcium/sodium antiporter [Prevotella sp.]
MVLSILYIIGGAILVLLGADKLTDGAVAIAERLRVPQIVIGLTIVAIGTSMPEFCVSLVSALKGTPDLSVGNVVGSNIFNSLLIVGVAAVVAPIMIQPMTVRKDIPFALVASALMMIMCFDGLLSRFDAAVLFLLFLIFMVFTLKGALAAKVENEKSQNVVEIKTGQMSVGKATLFMVLGLVGLVIGSNVFVDGAVDLAQLFGISEAVIGLTIVAMGTSLPELATTAVSAYKGNSGIAIGNVLGSNVFNVLMVLGITGLISPMQLTGVTMNDLSLMILSVILLWLFSFTKLVIQRWEGFMLIAVFVAYMVYLVMGLV